MRCYEYSILKNMKIISVAGDPHSMTALMVSKSDGDSYHEHQTITIQSSEGSESVEKTIFRIVDAGEDKWELQFE